MNNITKISLLLFMLTAYQQIDCTADTTDALDVAFAQAFHEEAREMDHVMQEEIKSVKDKVETIKTMNELGRCNYEKSVSTEQSDDSDPIYANETQYDAVENWNGTTTHTQTTVHIENGEKTTMTESWTTKSEKPSMLAWLFNW